MKENIKNPALIRKLRDPKFYLENFCKIKGKKPGSLIPFILNEAQKDLFNTVRKHSRTIILKARQIGFCANPSTKILTKDLQWITLDEIKIGAEIVAVDENIPGGKGSDRKMRTAIVEKKSEVFEPGIKLTMDDGRELITTKEHRFLLKTRGGSYVDWREVGKINIGDEIRYITKPWGETTNKDAWFGGVIDGEGCLRFKNHTGCEVAVTQRTHEILWEQMNSYVKERGFVFQVEIDNRPAGNGKFGSKQCGKVVVSRMDEVFRLIGLTRPVRFVGKEWWSGKSLPGKKSGIGWAKVVLIEHLPAQRMIDLQTSEHTYIAEGFVSHNSTAMVGYFYHNTIMTPGTNTAIIGYNSDLTSELLEKVKTFYKTTPPELRPTIKYDSKYEISFPRMDSKILVLPSTLNVGRGYTLHNVLATELSAWEKAEDKMMTLEASVPINGKLVIESTPRGIGNLYHRLWMSDNDYIKKEYGWWWGYTKEEVDIIERRMNNPQLFAQEYGLTFLASGRPVFDQRAIEKQRKNILKEGDETLNWDEKPMKVYVKDDLRIYKEPNKDSFYVIGVDVSEGVQGGDYSVAVIFDRRTGEEVAFYRGLLAPDMLASKLNKWGRLYNNALMVVEINNHGLTTMTVLRQLVYPSLYFRPAKIESMGIASSDKLGWRTTKVTRPLLIDDLAQAVREDSLTIHSKELLDEMMVMVYNDNNDPVAQDGFHDDTIFAAGICFQGFKIMYDKPLDQLNYEDHLPKTFAY